MDQWDVLKQANDMVSDVTTVTPRPFEITHPCGPLCVLVGLFAPFWGVTRPSRSPDEARTQGGRSEEEVGALANPRVPIRSSEPNGHESEIDW